MRTEQRLVARLLASLALVGCGEEPAEIAQTAPRGGVLASGGAMGASADTEGVPVDETSIGEELRIDVEGDHPALVQLSTASKIHVEGDYQASHDWDLAFQGWELFTNGGASGAGKAAAFGPLPFTYWTAARAPTDIPFLIEDKTAGAFRDWHLYDAQWHALYSRFHRYGVKSGERLFKVQLLGYYGEAQGAPVSALYQIRYAEVLPAGNGPVTTIVNLDATAGGLGGDAETPSTCLTLGTGEQRALTPAAALRSSSWDLCFRRDAISVNGGLGGPGGVTAVDLDAHETETETLDSAKRLTPETEAAAFDTVDYEQLTDPALEYRGDRVVSAFTQAWVERSAGEALLPRDSTWLVVGADGKSRYLLQLTGLQRSTAEAAGTVVMRIQQAR